MTLAPKGQQPKKKRNYRRKYNKKPTLTGLSKKVKALAKSVEYKFTETELTNYITETPSFVCLTNSVPCGTKNYERIGNAVTAKSVQIRMIMRSDTWSSDLKRQMVRVILMRDNSDYQETSDPINTDLLERNVTASDTITSPYKMNQKRFKILSDKVYSLNEKGSGNSQVFVKMYKRLNTKVCWKGNLDTDMTNGHLWLMLIVSPNTAGTSGYAATVSGWSRVLYTDS